MNIVSQISKNAIGPFSFRKEEKQLPMLRRPATLSTVELKRVVEAMLG